MTPTTASMPSAPLPAARALADLARAECQLPANRFGPAFWGEHLELVTRLALELAPRLGADPRVIALAGPLHDLAAVRDFSCLAAHAERSAHLARQLLQARGEAPALVEAVARAIEAHSAPVPPGQGTPEQVCLSNADVLAHLARPAYWTYYLFGVRELTYGQGLAWLRGRIGSAWEALTPEARERGAEDRERLAKLLEGAG